MLLFVLNLMLKLIKCCEIIFFIKNLLVLVKIFKIYYLILGEVYKIKKC